MGVIEVDSGGHAELQSAVNDALIGDTVHAKQHTFVLNPAIKWPPDLLIVKSGITLKGDGIDKSIILHAPTPEIASKTWGRTITSEGNLENFTLEDITVDQNGFQTPYNFPENTPETCAAVGGVWEDGVCKNPLGGPRYGIVSPDPNGSHKNLTYRRVKAINAFGGALGTHNDSGHLLIEDCIVNNVWTGMGFGHVISCDILRNRISNTYGDAIFPQWTTKNAVISDNIIENVRDVAIDITANDPQPPHENIKCLNNIIKNGTIRVSNALNTEVSHNKLTGDPENKAAIYFDGGQGPVHGAIANHNEIVSPSWLGLGFLGVLTAEAINNTIAMLAPTSLPESYPYQVGMCIAIHGQGKIEDNTITNPADYGMAFKGWRISDADLSILRNKILDFGLIGIFDDNQRQHVIVIEENEIISEKSTAAYSVKTGYEANTWTIRNNVAQALMLTGNDAIYAPTSIVEGNTPPKPPSSVLPIAVGVSGGAAAGYAVGGLPGAVVGSLVGGGLGVIVNRLDSPLLVTCRGCSKRFATTTRSESAWCPHCGREQTVK